MNTEFQHMGLGTILMDKLKAYVSKKLPECVKTIVTFADNRATKFFGKNLFTKVQKSMIAQYE